MFYSWHEQHYPSPGTGNFAFNQNTTLPAHAVQAGGNMVRGQLNVYFGGNVFTMPTVPTDGLGGLIAGQIVLQPLIGNDN